MVPAGTLTFAESQVRACARALRNRLPGCKIWLFGSAARREATPDSDIDLLVVLPDNHGIERPSYEAKLAVAKARTGVATDVLVITEREAAVRRTALIEDALREGKLLE